MTKGDDLMKTRTKVSLAVSLVALVAGVTITGTSLADRGAPGWRGSEPGTMEHHERSRHRRHHGWDMRGERLLEHFDSNNDGKLTQDEINQARRDRLAQFDTNKDGKLTLQEYEALWLDAMRRRMVEQFQALDSDGDAIVTTEEFVAPFNKAVRRLDRTDDGQLTHDDFRRR
jgi:Ca2+-binding EF-hand superfamily protein